MTHSSLHDALPICRDKYWQILHDRDFVKGQVAYPYKPEQVFVQDQGRDWRRQQDEALVHAGGWIIFGIGLLLELRSEENTSELQYLMRISYAVFCWKKKKKK